MITFTTYGTWLQGDKRGYVKDGQVLEENHALYKANLEKLRHEPVELTMNQRQIVHDAIVAEAKSLGQEIYALTVVSNHVHIVAAPIAHSIEQAVSHYKNAGRLALRRYGFVRRVWTRGFDRRFCFDRQQLESRIRYVNSHRDTSFSPQVYPEGQQNLLIGRVSGRGQ